MKHISVIAAAAALCLVGASAPAQAQIYSWRDANGILTVSDRPQGGGARVAKAIPVRMGLQMGLPAVVMSAGTTFEPLIREHAGQQGIRAELVRAVIQVESAFNPRARSPKGAMGLMQLMPSTAKQFGVLDPFNPSENIRAGVRYLKILLNKYNDNEQLALAAYNAGPGAVDKYGSKVPPYKETQNYVKRITNLNLNGVSLGRTATRMYKVTEVVGGQTIVKYTNIKPSDGYQEVRR